MYILIRCVFFNREFLTGFHKRKLERKAKAKETALAFCKQERAKARKAVCLKKKIFFFMPISCAEFFS